MPNLTDALRENYTENAKQCDNSSRNFSLGRRFGAALTRREQLVGQFHIRAVLF